METTSLFNCLNKNELGLIGASFSAIFFGFLCVTTNNFYIYWTYMMLSSVSFLYGDYCMVVLLAADQKRLKDSSRERDSSNSNLEESVVDRYSFLLANRRIVLFKTMLYLFKLFPVVYYLRMASLLDDNMTHTLMMLSSICTKVIFVSLCMDAGLEVTDPSILLYLQEVKANETRRAFLRYVFHEIRVPINSISLGLEVLYFCNI